MNYQLHYDQLVARAAARTLDGYSERHHVVPVCMGGSNEAANIVRLTPEEHYVAHQLLYRIHRTRSLFNAIKCMTWKSKHTPTRNNRLYGWIRRQHAAYMSMQTGRKQSAQTKAKIGAANKVALTGKRLSDQHRKNISTGGTGLKRTDETRRRISVALTTAIRPPMSDAVKQQHSIRMSSTRWWTNGLVNRRAPTQPDDSFWLGRLQRATK